MVRRESRSSTISHITLGTKQTGAPSAGNLHAGCDVAGAGNGFTVWLLRHSQRKRGATARLDLRNTAPVLDPTGQRPRILCAPSAIRFLGRHLTKTALLMNWAVPPPGVWRVATEWSATVNLRFSVIAE